MIVAGDISLAEMSRYPVPIMARPPLGVSDITLENWLQEVGQSQKGVKLTFTSTRTVEPAFRVLARHADQLRGPLILSADILARPAAVARAGRQQQTQQPVDAWTFLMLCRTRFPKSIISIGWCPAEPHQPGAGLGGAPLAAGSPSLHSSAESMFELDMVVEPALLGGALNQHIQQLAGQQRQPPGRPHQQPMGAFALAQGPAAGARLATGASLHQHQHQAAGHHHHILSSTASLNSSSGNSSGSPSPTSPIGHLLSPAQLGHLSHLNQLNQQLGARAPDSTEQLIFAAAAAEQHQLRGAGKQVGWPSLAAAMVAASGLQAAGQQQLPLNLNINEAEPQHAAALSDLAHKIHSLQHGLAAPAAHDSVAAVALANKLFNAKTHNHNNNTKAQHGWQHVSKKPALANRLNSNSPSPQSGSPKQQQFAFASNLLCVKTHPGHSSSAQDQARGQGPAAHHQLAAPATCPGYTREMIDKMASLVKEYNLTQPVTFPVEARLLCNKNSSLAELQRLLYQVGSNSTLTVVAQQEDLIKVDDLLTIRKHFAANQILFDLPDELAASLRHELDLA